MTFNIDPRSSILKYFFPAAALVALAGACSDDDALTGTTTTTATTTTTSTGGPGGAGSGGGTGGTHTGDVYEFESKFVEGESAVDHSGQSMRHVLIQSLADYVEAMTAAIDTNAFTPADINTVVLALDYYYVFDDQTSAEDPHGIVTTPDPLQMSFGDISSGKNLKAKFAGNDTATDYRDWSSEFVGWSDASIMQYGGGINTPEVLLYAFFHTLGHYAVDRVNGTIPYEPGTTVPIANVYVTVEGRDLKQLIQKFLLMGVTYAQATDDYLHDDVADSGILAPNTQDGDAPYSILGHFWDEGFGYFGAARDYLHYTDDEVAKTGMGRPDWQGYHDTSGDNAIDLTREMNWGASTNCAKRDLGATDAVDFSSDAFNAFLAGRALIHEAGATLTTQELADLTEHAEAATLAWEKAIAATLVHYINATVAHTEALGTTTYSFLTHAKEWSELKGFALGMQFNPKKQLSDTDFTTLHELIGDAPVLATATQPERDAYVTDLMAARDILQTSYNFSQANVDAW